MNLQEFNALVGGDSYVRCSGKKRLDTAVVTAKAAESHLFSGGQIGWWVKPGYIVVDIDEGQKEALKIIKRLGIKTLIAKTPKGLHLYFKTDKDFPQWVGKVLPCGLRCDFRCANKGYVLLPFGTDDRKFNKVREIAELPLCMTPMDRKESLYQLKEGDGRNAALFSHLMAYKNRGASDDDLEEMAVLINEIVFKEPMEEKELFRIVDNTSNYKAQDQGDNPYLLYNSKGQPYQINKRAICDYFVNTGEVFVLGGECYQYRHGVYRESGGYIRNKMKELIMLDRFISQTAIMDCYRMLLDDMRIKRSPDSVNRDKGLINFKNGVWDIEKQTLLPHSPSYFQTIQIPHEIGVYKPFKQTRLYKFFKLTKIPKEDIKMMLRYMAYCMTLEADLKTFMVLLGKSNTGKSVLIRFTETLVGVENTSALSMHELNAKFYPAQLYGKLMNSCADNGSLPLTSIENLKKITGGDQIMHEKKGKDPFFFVPFCKLLFSFNQLPLQLEEKSNAFYQRMRILSMEEELFLNSEYVDALCNEGTEEIIPYLLTLLPVEKIPRTETSNELVESLRSDSDSVHSFLNNCCEIRPSALVSKTALYSAYTDYCLSMDREAHKKQGFLRNLRSRGFKEVRHPKTREACWKGLELKKGGFDE